MCQTVMCAGLQDKSQERCETSNEAEVLSYHKYRDRIVGRKNFSDK